MFLYLTEGRQLSVHFQCPFFETSAKIRYNVDDVFEEVVRERDEREAVPGRDRPARRARRAQVAQRDVRVEIRQLGELPGSSGVIGKQDGREQSGWSMGKRREGEHTRKTARQDQRNVGSSRMVPRIHGEFAANVGL